MKHIFPTFLTIRISVHSNRRNSGGSLADTARHVRMRRYQREWYHAKRNGKNLTRSAGTLSPIKTTEQVLAGIAYRKKWASNNSGRVRQKALILRNRNREKINAQIRKHRAENPERHRAKWREWAARNKEYFDSPQRRIPHLLRCSLRHAVKMKGMKKGGRYAAPETAKFLIWLALKMGIDPVKDGYQIDHIIPLSKIDLSNPLNFTMAKGMTNVRWLSKFNNNSKNDRMPHINELMRHYELVQEFHKRP